MRSYEVMRDKTNTITLRDDRKRIPISQFRNQMTIFSIEYRINQHLIRTVNYERT